MAASTAWPPENVMDVAESLGIGSLTRDVQEHLARDVEHRIAQILEEALKFMRHAKRTTLTTSDISEALRLLNVEPLYGYESTRPLRFGEAHGLFYVEDEEVDFEKLINAPLPKVPREISYTAHWLAVEGVQPSIPQNPTAEIKTQDSRPSIRHILSRELQLYFDRVTDAIMDENEEYRVAGLASLRTDPGIHQLVPYFVQYAADKTTHSRETFVLTQTLLMIQSLLENASIYMEPYIPALVPSVLTCLLAKNVGSENFAIRDFAASILKSISGSTTLKTRLARSYLKAFLDTHKSVGTHYGAVLGLMTLGREVVRSLLLPNLKTYDLHIKDDAEPAGVIIRALSMLKGDPQSDDVSEEVRKQRLNAIVGETLAKRILDDGDEALIGVLTNVD